MNMVRGRAEARWLPSRHHFAMFRLYAYLRLRGARPEPREGLVLIVDRDQTAFEHHGASLWIVLTLSCYVASTLFPNWPVAAAIVPSVLIAAAAIEVPFCLSGVVLRRGARVNGAVVMLLLVAASAHFARAATWVRFAAWQFLGVLAVNAVAAIIVFLLREPIARLERGVLSEQ